MTMRISEITLGGTNEYGVCLTPNFIERMFGVKPKTKYFYCTGATYISGGGHVYINSEGNKLGNGDSIGEAIDRFRYKLLYINGQGRSITPS